MLYEHETYTHAPPQPCTSPCHDARVGLRETFFSSCMFIEFETRVEDESECFVSSASADSSFQLLCI